ncbi:hypothetical protein MSAN_01716500 [Mycena sanguinolenta]|uniref:Uncharacterized protein n=1 Tax=Mycena sanguinolenta TaxID=230812 RepID=A0A8H7CT45_9AGAR|nr:hypothetical protein MSAN_01716500 [Mycena sanguinolenta]
MHSEAGPGYTLADERSNMLERLNDIPLKGFQEMEETPSSATMSLPTPEAQHDVPLPPVDTLEALGVPQTDPVSYLFAGDDGIVVPPAAPRMKDYDTFTEGTAEGSFNSIPAAETNELGEPIYPISARALAALPSMTPLFPSSSGARVWRILSLRRLRLSPLSLRPCWSFGTSEANTTPDPEAPPAAVQLARRCPQAAARTLSVPATAPPRALVFVRVVGHA